MKKSDKIIFTLAVSIGFFLLLFKISSHNLWIDEAYTLRMISYSFKKLCLTVFQQDPHPPFYYIFLKIWCLIFGSNLLSCVCFSVFFALLAVFAGCILSRIIFGNGFSMIVPLIMTSPFFIIFSKHIRYYSFVSFLVLMNIIFLIKFIESSKKVWWYLLLFFHVVLLYSDYPASTIFAGEFIAVLILRRDKLKQLFLLDIIVVVLFLPWLSRIFYSLRHLSSLPVVALFSSGVKGFFVRVFFSVYDFILGECVYPWSIHVTLPIFLIFSIGFIRFVKIFPSFSKRHKENSMLLITTVGISFFIGIFMANRFVGKQSFVYMPSRMMFCFIPFMIVFSRGIFSFRNYRYFLMMVIVVLNFFGLKNYYTGQNYINPIYAVDWDDAATFTKDNYRYGDIVISDNTEVMDYYVKSFSQDTLFFENQDRLKKYLLAENFDKKIRFFLTFTRRDSTRSGYFEEKFIKYLIDRSDVLEKRDYGAVSDKYYDFKKRIAGRAYRYKMSFYLLSIDPNVLLRYFK